VSFGTEIPFTVLKLDPDRKHISENLDRGLLVNVQLPQKYERSALLSKHILADKEGCYFTEDASLMHHYGEKVEFIAGRSHNIKVTNHDDVEVVEALIEKRKLFE
jgi:2-C-methyl-D-erythritol 4-phosphate cytidylyltransferase